MIHHKEIFVERIMNNSGFISEGQFHDYLSCAHGNEILNDKDANNNYYGMRQRPKNMYIFKPNLYIISDKIREKTNDVDILHALIRSASDIGIIDLVFPSGFVNWFDRNMNIEIDMKHLNTPLSQLVDHAAFKDLKNQYETLSSKLKSLNVNTWRDLFFYIMPYINTDIINEKRKQNIIPRRGYYHDDPGGGPVINPDKLFAVALYDNIRFIFPPGSLQNYRYTYIVTFQILDLMRQSFSYQNLQNMGN